MITLCYYYTTTGYPTFKPKCTYDSSKRASLRCHHHMTNKCPGYTNEDQMKMLRGAGAVCRRCTRDVQ